MEMIAYVLKGHGRLKKKKYVCNIYIINMHITNLHLENSSPFSHGAHLFYFFNQRSAEKGMKTSQLFDIFISSYFS